MKPEMDVTRARELRPGVAAVIQNGSGQILLQRRSDNGLWGLPGGSVEIGESVRGAIVREVREETGLSVEVVRLIGVYSDPRIQIVRYPDGNVVHYISTLFACRILAGELQTGDETLDLRFHDPADLPDDLVPMHRIRIQDALANSPAAFIR
ncbi:MAG: NUDIX domain-containing protein [Candidatus Methylomirabilota bacterium]